MTGIAGRTFDGMGLVMLLEPEGKSVVSDIDDTIKVSEIPAGKAIVLRNTFLRPYVAAEGMRDRYLGLGDVSFHYVSGSPWQLFGLLHKFLIEQDGFPMGHISHEKPEDQPTRSAELHQGPEEHRHREDATKEQKISQISALMDNLPAGSLRSSAIRGNLTRRCSPSCGQTRGRRSRR